VLGVLQRKGSRGGVSKGFTILVREKPTNITDEARGNCATRKKGKNCGQIMQEIHPRKRVGITRAVKGPPSCTEKANSQKRFCKQDP